MDLTLPTFLPGGGSLWVDEDFYKRLHWGDASIGWNGDPDLGVYYLGDRIEIWRWCEDGEPRRIMRSKPGVRALDTAALRFLAEHDSRRRGGYDVKAEVDAHNAAIDADKERDFDAKLEAAADKLHWALRKDLGAYVGGSTRRLMPLPAAPWKKDSDASHA